MWTQTQILQVDDEQQQRTGGLRKPQRCTVWTEAAVSNNFCNLLYPTDWKAENRVPVFSTIITSQVSHSCQVKLFTFSQKHLMNATGSPCGWVTWRKGSRFLITYFSLDDYVHTAEVLQLLVEQIQLDAGNFPDAHFSRSSTSGPLA